MSNLSFQSREKQQWAVVRMGETIGTVSKIGTVVQFLTRSVQAFTALELSLVREFMAACSSK